MNVLWVLIVLTVILLAGCGGSGPLIPICDRPLTEDEAAQVLALADRIAAAGPQWATYAQTARSRLAQGRMCVGKLPDGAQGWAQWCPLRLQIILAPAPNGFFQLNVMDQAGGLLIEACHSRCACVGKCHSLVAQWEQDYVAVVTEA